VCRFLGTHCEHELVELFDDVGGNYRLQQAPSNASYNSNDNAEDSDSRNSNLLQVRKVFIFLCPANA
jgi:hypothetical protein